MQTHSASRKPWRRFSACPTRRTWKRSCTGYTCWRISGAGNAMPPRVIHSLPRGCWTIFTFGEMDGPCQGPASPYLRLHRSGFPALRQTRQRGLGAKDHLIGRVAPQRENGARTQRRERTRTASLFLSDTLRDQSQQPRRSARRHPQAARFAAGGSAERNVNGETGSCRMQPGYRPCGGYAGGAAFRHSGKLITPIC